MEMMSWIRQQAEMLVLIQLFCTFVPELHMRSSEDLQPQLQGRRRCRVRSVMNNDRAHILYFQEACRICCSFGICKDLDRAEINEQ